MSEPVFRLGVSRAASRDRLTFWEIVRGLFRRYPVGARPAAIPRPPRSVLLSRTTAEVTGAPPEPASGRPRSSQRR